MVKRLLTSLLLVVTMTSCGSERTDVTSETPKSVAPNGWDLFYHAAFSVNGDIAFLGEDPDDNTRIGISEDGIPKPVSPEGIHPSDFAWMPDGKSLLIATRCRRRPFYRTSRGQPHYRCDP